MLRSLILALLSLASSIHFASADAPVYLGTFTSPGLCSPRGIALSPSGDLYVGSDCLALMHMERLTASGSVLATWPFPTGYFGPPNGVALDGTGNVFVTDYELGRILKFDGSGNFLTQWSSLLRPADLAVDAAGNVFVVELGGKRVQKFSGDGSPLATIGTAGSGTGQFQDPVGLCLDASGRIYVADGSRKRILRFLPSGSFDMEFATPVDPSDVAVGPDGNVYVITFYVNGNAQQIRQYSQSGQLLLSFGVPITGADGMFRILIAPGGAIYVTVQLSNSVAQFQIDMSTIAVASTFGRLKAMYR